MKKKITIVGAGRVGSTAAFWCFSKELGDIVIWNRTEKTAKGIAIDISESSPLMSSDVKITGTNNFKKTRNSDVIVITAGVQRKEGMTRDDLLETNLKIVRNVVKELVKYSKKAVIIVVSNPLDAMTYATLKQSKFKRNKVIGMAGILDSSRFKSFIANELNVGVEDVNAIVLGGHGDTMIPLISHANINSIPLTQLMSRNKINQLIKRTRNAGAEIIKLEKSSAFYSTGVAISEMVEAIIRDKNRVLPCAAYLNGEYGVKGIFMGVPIILGSNGVEKVIQLRLSKEEKNQLKKSISHVKKLVNKVKKL